MPLLSQRDEWLEKALDSALGQSVECEVLVVTSHKTPRNNLDILDRYSATHGNLRVLGREERQNFAGAINSGIRAARSPRVGLLFCDDWLDRSAIERCLAFDSDIVSTGANIYTADGKSVFKKRVVTEAGYQSRPTLERKAAYLSHFYLFRREKLLEIGGVDEDIGLTGADDFDMIWTLLENGASVSIVEDSMYQFRDHADYRLTLRSREEQVRDITRIFRKHGVPESEIDRLLALHSDWFGVQIQTVLEQRAS